MSPKNRVTWIALLCAVTLGCSPLPTAPELPARQATGLAAGSVPQETGGVIKLPGLDTVELEPIDPSIIPDTLELIRAVEGDRGDSLKLGMVDLEVPAGAYDGDAEIRMTVPDSTLLEVQLDIYPASKNHFDEPVKLAFDLSVAHRPSELHVYWLDETLGEWVEVPSDYDPVKKKITAPLSHFSTYKVAKASWAKASWGVAP